MMNNIYEAITGVLQKLARNWRFMEPVPVKVVAQQDYQKRQILSALQNRLANGEISDAEYIRQVERLCI
ncbi:MAG: hypothetical protein ACOX1T_08895 [Saccharofermentanales bacterium]